MRLTASRDAGQVARSRERPAQCLRVGADPPVSGFPLVALAGLGGVVAGPRLCRPVVWGSPRDARASWAWLRVLLWVVRWSHRVRPHRYGLDAEDDNVAPAVRARLVVRVPNAVHLVVVGMVTRQLLDVPVDDHRHFVANIVGCAAGRVAFEVPPASRSAPGAEREAAVDEVPVERRHARLAAAVDGAEGDVLEALQVGDDLGRAQPSLGLDDRGHVRVGACVRRIHQSLQPLQFLGRLAHRWIMPPGDTQGLWISVSCGVRVTAL